MRNLSSIIIFTLLSSFLAGCDSLDEETTNITKENWESHPLIEEVIEVYRKVTIIRDSGKLLVQEKHRDENGVGCKDKLGNIGQLLAFDSTDKVRYIKLTELLATNSVGTIEYYYDRNEIIRFVNRVFGDSKLSNRIYYDKNGKYIFSIDKIDKNYFDDRGSGKSFIPVAPVRAKNVFARTSGCKYIFSGDYRGSGATKGVTKGDGVNLPQFNGYF